MKKATAKTIKGLVRVIKNNYNNGFEVAIMKDCKGLYLLGFAIRGFPSSNNDECLFRANTSGVLESLKWNIENGLDEKTILGTYRIF